MTASISFWVQEKSLGLNEPKNYFNVFLTLSLLAVKNKCNLMNSAVPFVNCVQIKHPNPRGMNENEQERN